MYAEVFLPPIDGYPATTGVNVEEYRNQNGELQINVFRNWVGSSGSPEFRNYMFKTMEELRDRTIEKCSGTIN